MKTTFRWRITVLPMDQAILDGWIATARVATTADGMPMISMWPGADQVVIVWHEVFLEP